MHLGTRNKGTAGTPGNPPQDIYRLQGGYRVNLHKKYDYPIMDEVLAKVATLFE
jgi:hypothetical protein